MTQEQLIALPKIELHCQLDGSLSREFIEKRLGRKVHQEELSVSDNCRISGKIHIAGTVHNG